MRRQLSLLVALLRKDVQLFWQFAALNGVLIALWQFPDLVAQLGPLAGLVHPTILLATILLILVIFYEDAIVSLKHDWLARPISGTTLLLAKCTSVFLAIVVPSIFGGIANELYEGRAVGEALLAGVSFGASAGLLSLILIVMAFAALTASIRQAIIVLLACIAVVALLTVSIGGVSGSGEAVASSGSSWVIVRPLGLVLAAVAVSVLWLQYHYRHTRAALIIVGVAVIAGSAFLASMTWPRVFGVQKLLSKDPAAASTVRVELASGCFPARVFDADRSIATAQATAAITPDLYSEEQRERAGPQAVAFATQLIQRHVPADHRLTVGNAQITYRTASGELRTLHPEQMRWTATAEGLLAANHYWLLPRKDYESLATNAAVETKFNYSLNLLAPAATVEFAADAARSFYPKIGYCSATFDRAIGSVDVDCFKAGAQSAQLVAKLDGAPDIESNTSGYPDFTPPALDFWGGQRHAVQLRARGDAAPRVRLTAFETRAHFDRRFVLPGVLGAPVSACPAP